MARTGWEQEIILLQVIEDSCHVPGLFDSRSRSHLDMHTHLIGYNSRQGRLAKTGRPVQQNVIQRLFSLLCRLDGNQEIFPDPLLAYIVLKTFRTERILSLCVLIGKSRFNDSTIHRSLSQTGKKYSGPACESCAFTGGIEAPP